MSPEYDDSRLRLEMPLEEILPGHDPTRGWMDVDDADESDIEQAVMPTDAGLADDDTSVPVIPKRANEFTCSRCFLIHHTSRLAVSNGEQLICADCV